MARRSSANTKEAMTAVRGQHKVAVCRLLRKSLHYEMGAQNGEDKKKGS